MRKRSIRILDLPSSFRTAVLLVLSIAFLLGGLSGCILVDQLVGDGSDMLGSYLDGYLSVVRSGNAVQPELWAVLWETVRWPLLIFVLGITPLGLIGIPILFVIRGFLLSFAIASFFRVLGLSGLIFSGVLFGLSGVLYVPALFHCGLQCFSASGAMVSRLTGEGKKAPLFERSSLICGCVCAAALCLCVLIDYSAVPRVLEALAEFLPT